VIDLAQLDISSPVSYLIAVLVPALDALIPVLPSETAVIALGVATAGGTDPRIAVLVALAALGAFVGDNAAYLVGRRFGPAVSRWIFAGERGERRRAWAQRSLAEYGTRIIVACRFIPGGRTAVTLTCGLIGYPRRSFVLGTAIAGVLWASYAFFIGRIGGQAFEGRPWAGLLVGLGLTVAVSGVIEAARRLRGRARRRAVQSAVPPGRGPDSGPRPGSGPHPDPGPHPDSVARPGPGPEPGADPGPGPDADPSPDAGRRGSTSPAHVLQTGSTESVCPGREERADVHHPACRPDPIARRCPPGVGSGRRLVRSDGGLTGRAPRVQRVLAPGGTGFVGHPEDGVRGRDEAAVLARSFGGQRLGERAGPS
jgi:membrane-associated protein